VAPGFDMLTEELLTYDEGARSLSYRAGVGMPRFVRSAVNTWRVRPHPDGGSRFDMAADLELAGTARALTPFLATYLWGVGRLTARDLQVVAETGRPRRGAARAVLDLVRPTSRHQLQRLVGVNGAFSATCGALLVVAPGWWSAQLGDAPATLVTAVGLGLLGYGTGLGPLVRRGNVPARLGRVLAGLDAARVLATAVLLFSTAVIRTVGTWSLLGTSAVVALLGAARWRAATDRSAAAAAPVSVVTPRA
jgi:hypothetical protein